MDKDIETYLRDLQDAMGSAGADPALVQDALYDAEEHLQSEMAAGGTFGVVAQAYGSPDEVAAAYLGTAPVHEMAAALAAPYPSGAAAVAGAAPEVGSEAAPEMAALETVAAATPPVAQTVPGETFVAPEVSSGPFEAGMPVGDLPVAPQVTLPVTASEPGVPADEGKVFCLRCGIQAPLGQTFCRDCGTPLPTADQLAAVGASGAGDTEVRAPRDPNATATGGPQPGQPPYGGQPAGGRPYGAAQQGRYPVGVQSGMAAAVAGRAQAAPSVWRDIFGVFADPRVWASLVYMIISLGLGIVYFTVVVTGLSTAGGMLVLIVGIPLLLLVLGLVRVLSLFEGRVVEVLLGTRMPRRLRPVPPNIGFFERIWFWLKDGRTWLSMLYMVLMLPLGIAYFTVAVTGLSVSLSLITSPVWAWIGLRDHVFIINGVPHDWWFPAWGIPVAFITGCVLLVGFMHLVKWIGRGHAAFAKAMLVRLAK